jgi:hypothetical protein
MLFITSIGDALKLPHSLMNAPGMVVVVIVVIVVVMVTITICWACPVDTPALRSLRHITSSP